MGRKIITKKGFWLLVGALILASAYSAWADLFVVATPSGVGTRINSLPYTINTPGFYYLAKNLTSAGNGITINVDDVTIDLMGFSLIGPGADSSIGIDLPGRTNVEIRNGTVRGFMSAGILCISAGKNNRVINMRIQGNGLGVHLVGSNHLVQNCNVSNNNSIGIWTNGYSSMITGNTSCDNGSTGIDCVGDGHNVIGNVVANNAGHGFNVSFVGPGPYRYLFDRNNVYNNAGGNINGSPPGAVWGLNAGIP